MTERGAKVYLVGFMATGKSTVGAILAARLGVEFVDLDAEIERREGKAIPALFSEDGEPAFREAEAEALRGVAERPAACVVACGGGTMLRAANVEAMRSTGVVVCLTALPGTVAERAAADDGRPLLGPAGDPGRAQRIEAVMSERAAVYGMAEHMVATDGRTPEEVALAIQSLL